jgi:hypothetical protein
VDLHQATSLAIDLNSLREHGRHFFHTSLLSDLFNPFYSNLSYGAWLLINLASFISFLLLSKNMRGATPGQHFDPTRLLSVARSLDVTNTIVWHSATRWSSSPANLGVGVRVTRLVRLG